MWEEGVHPGSLAIIEISKILIDGFIRFEYVHFSIVTTLHQIIFFKDLGLPQIFVFKVNVSHYLRLQVFLYANALFIFNRFPFFG
jgi:hypothetical protein